MKERCFNWKLKFVQNVVLKNPSPIIIKMGLIDKVIKNIVAIVKNVLISEKQNAIGKRGLMLMHSVLNV